MTSGRSPPPPQVQSRREGGLWNLIDPSTSHPSDGVVGRHHGMGVSERPKVILNPNSLHPCSATNSLCRPDRRALISMG